MIYYLVTARYSTTLNWLFRDWSPDLRHRITVMPYERFMTRKNKEPGTYIFTDLERLESWMRKALSEIWTELSEDSERFLLLNHPLRTMRRYVLLRSLFDQGSNFFNVYRNEEYSGNARFPVFLRLENDHGGSLTPLLHTEEELDEALGTVRVKKKDYKNLLIVEYCNTRDCKGVYRKYSAFIVGKRIIPRHLFFSKNWIVKLAVSDQKTCWEEEWDYFQHNPHLCALKEIFRLANVDYGRVDYGLAGSDIQVWEINTNPLIITQKHTISSERMNTHVRFVQELNGAYGEID